MTQGIENNAAVVIPYTADRRVLLQRKDGGYIWNPGMWCFFGGKIEDGEERDTQKTALRELVEETGLTFHELRFFEVRDYSDVAPASGLRRHGSLYVYTGAFDGDLSRLRLKEGAGMSLWERAEIDTLNMVPHNKESLLRFYTELNANKS